MTKVEKCIEEWEKIFFETEGMASRAWRAILIILYFCP
jgi:hypothetical protein